MSRYILIIRTERAALGLEPGLRERKKAQMRQQISDTATLMFLDQGFEEVRVADIAARVGVSEKTIYNYFPTKESLVFDQTDAQLTSTIAAVSNRAPGVSPVRAYLAEIEQQLALLYEDFEQTVSVVPRFGAMIDRTPALRAAWGDHRHRLVHAVADVLAGDLGVDPHDPEPLTAARALISLTELYYDSVLRHVFGARSGPELLELVMGDLERGARLLDTAAWYRFQRTAP
jgi:AcrR family transcriptional regulator